MAEAKKTTKAKTSAKAPAKAKATKTVKKTVKAEEPVIEQEIIETTLEQVEEAPLETTDVIEATENSETTAEVEEAKTTKAGKHSHKAQEEAAAKEAKEERKESGETEDTKPKQHANPTRPRLERQSKNFRKSAEKIEVGKVYPLNEAIALAKETSTVKFDATVELHVNLNVDPRQADQNIRDNLVLPAGTGKTVRVAVLTDDAEAAKKAGADLAGTDELLAQLDKGQINFDILVATPALMSKLGKYARVLGPRGLMPNPKSGTVTTDVNKAISESKAGRVEYRVDSTGIIHVGIGKVSFSAAQLQENLDAILANIKANKPASVKAGYFKAIHIATTMGPSITVELASVN